jgi:hypothetical protein
MSACVVGRAGREEISQVTTLYVTSRVTQGYEGKSNIISAAEWDMNGRPPLASPAALYGVTGLALTWEQAEPTPVFTAAYDKWNPASGGDAPPAGTAAAPKSEGHHVVDKVWLRRDRGDWVIHRIDRQSEVPLPAP